MVRGDDALARDESGRLAAPAMDLDATQRGRTDEAVGLIHQIKHRRNDNRAGEDTMMRATCCFHGVASTTDPSSSGERSPIAATLKTGQLVDATPWKQQVALIIGVLAGRLSFRGA